MRVLLDENLPKRLKQDLTEYEVYTVRDKGWNGIKNGELLKLMIAENFDALLTFDKNLQYQQNFEKYTITFIILSASSNTYVVLKNLSDKIRLLLNKMPLPSGPVLINNE